MRILVLALLTATALQAADERKLALQATAQADFDRVLTADAPDLAQATACLQSQAMLLSIASPEETPAIAFRKAYCTLARATAIQDRATIAQAGDVFDDAVADSEAAAARQKLPQNIPSTWRIFAAVARLSAGAPGPSQEQSLTAAVDASDCQTTAAPVEFCHTVHQLGSAWLGWIALGRGDSSAAARRFMDSNAPAWEEWVAGLEAFRRGNYSESSADYSRAIGIWRGALPGSLAQRLNPPPDMSAMLVEWGGAQLLANDAAGAVNTLDAAVKADASNARALYLRGLAKERAGRTDAALDDYNLASRAAFAKTGDAAAAEAHFYRGILLYRRKDFQRAENEFSSALNVDTPAPWQPDARAWRHLSAVAGGACGASREYLQRALASVSPYFPKDEAQTAFAACPVTSAVLPNREVPVK